MSPTEVMEELEPYLPFVQGITTSGGECTRYPKFLTELFKLVHAKGKSAFVDTNGENDFSQMPELAAAMDQAMLDVKSVIDSEHRALTGQSCEMVLKNLDFLAQAGKLYEIRTVVVPSLLDSRKTVLEASRRIALYPEIRYKLIRFRSWGVRGDLQQTPSPSMEYMEELSQIARREGVRDVIIV